MERLIIVGPTRFVVGAPHRRLLLILAGVSAGYVAAQLLAFPPATFLGLDESIYYSQVAPHVPAAFMAAHRARGITFLAAPVVAVTRSMVGLRVYLGLLSGAGLFLAFWPWLKLRHGAALYARAVPLAAALFAALWVSLFYGPQLMPNLPAALCTVAAVGLFLQAVQTPGRWPPVAGMTAAFALLALLRPTETLPVAAVLCAAALLRRPWRQLQPLIGIAGGMLIGWIPWVIEAQLHYGGIAARLQQAGRINDTGWHFILLRHLQAFSSTQSACYDTASDCGHINIIGLAVWVAVPTLVATGLYVARRTPDLPALVLATVTAAATAFPYLFYTGTTAPRYLLPAYALLALPAAFGLTTIAARGRLTRIVTVTAVALFATGQFAVGYVKGFHAEANHATAVRVAEHLATYGIHPGCTIYGDGSWQIGVAARCDSLGDTTLSRIEPSAAWMRALLSRQAARGAPIALVSSSAHDKRIPAGWTRRRVLSRPSRYLYLPG